MRIDVIRHGACKDNVFLRGHIDSPLSYFGEKQMRHALADIPVPDLILSSPSKRNLRFAQRYFERVTVWPSLLERDFGAWDGLSLKDLESRFPEQVKAYMDNPFADIIPGSETLQAFETRVATAWRHICKLDRDHIVVFTHAGVQRMLLKILLGFPNESFFNLKINYATRLTFEVNETQQGFFSQLVEMRQYEQDMAQILHKNII